MKYQEIPDYDPSQLELLEGNDFGSVIMALLSGVQYSGQYKLAVDSTRKFLSHHDESVRGIAVECIGHIARLWKKLPTDLVEAAHKAMKDESDWVRGKASDTLDDLEVFIKKYKGPL